MGQHLLTGNTKSRLIIRKWIHTFLCGTLVMLMTACAASYRPVIINPDLDQWDGKRGRYVNLFPSTYGYLEESEFDKIEFRQSHEIGDREYALVTDPRGDIDRSKGYDAADYTVTPNMDLIHHPQHDLQITWIRHATFLIQLGEKFQILVDPVLAKIDGMAGFLMKYADTMELFADPPLIVQDLPLTSDSENPGANQIAIVAVSHDHFDHLNYNTLKQLPADTHY